LHTPAFVLDDALDYLLNLNVLRDVSLNENISREHPLSIQVAAFGNSNFYLALLLESSNVFASFADKHRGLGIKDRKEVGFRSWRTIRRYVDITEEI
jgi:hypothetical protein